MAKIFQKSSVAVEIRDSSFSIINRVKSEEAGGEDADAVELTYPQYEELKELLAHVEEKMGGAPAPAPSGFWDSFWKAIGVKK